MTKRGRFQLDLHPNCVSVTLPSAAAVGSAAELQAAGAAAMGDGAVAVTVPQPEGALSASGGGAEGTEGEGEASTTVVLVTFETHEKADAALKRGATVPLGGTVATSHLARAVHKACSRERRHAAGGVFVFAPVKEEAEEAS